MKKIKDRKDIDPGISLTVLFSAVLFTIISATMVLVVCLMVALVEGGVISFGNAGTTGGLVFILLLIAIISILVGTVIAVMVSKYPLGPINKVIEGMDRLASGHYDTRIEISRLEIARKVRDSFNKLASELENTEMLRSGFINNFSHEFKTPIVSILGFAKLLKKGGLTEAEQREYLDIIEEESERLSNMATNVLNLTKVENQTILTDVTEFNVSEQIRSCIILLEKKWTAKDIDMQIDFDEHLIWGNMELMKQVWINLIDNAVKFSPERGAVQVGIEEQEDSLKVHISNRGPEISDENRDRIFNKFFQADLSHSSEGNGIGLAIAKKVVALHEGTIEVKSNEGMNTFTVVMPKTPALKDFSQR